MNPEDSRILLLLVGYAIIWFGVFGYLVYAVIRLRSVERELRELTEVGQVAGARSPAPGGE